MKKLNNEGFAITVILFSLLVLFLVIFSVLILTMNNSIKLNDYLKQDVMEDIEQNSYCDRTSLVCKRAVTLHTETCNQIDSTNFCAAAGYTENGSNGTSTITYGNLGVKGALTSGDAFDCDVNCDGVYDEVTERFYYVDNMENNIVALIYYNNVSGGLPDNSKLYPYYSTAQENWHGPVDAIKQLPTTKQWKGVSLSNSKRAITTDSGATSTIGGILPTEFSYSGYAARFLTVQEINSACNITIGSNTMGEIDECNYLMENTIYSSNTIPNYGYWIESPLTSTDVSAFNVSAYRSVSEENVTTSDKIGVRPVIEVPISNIEY